MALERGAEDMTTMDERVERGAKLLFHLRNRPEEWHNASPNNKMECRCDALAFIEADDSARAFFRLGGFTAASGQIFPWKIECDALTQEDWSCLARIVSDFVGLFSKVEGVPEGGLPLARALFSYSTTYKFGNVVKDPLLIVDDVLTTGASMERVRDGRDAIGAVVFARGPCPSWVTPVFKMGADDSALRKLTRQLADDLASYINIEHQFRNDHPDEMRRWKRDMAIVEEARKALGGQAP